MLFVAFFSYGIFYVVRQVPGFELVRRALGKRHRTLYYWIKMENLLVSAICFPVRELSC